MLIIDKNLEGLARQFKLAPPNLIESFCIGVRLGGKIFRPKKTNAEGETIRVVYGHSPNPQDLFQEETVKQNIVLAPNESVICSSADAYNMPAGYFGLLQTKGTLARTFVSVSCNDGQVEPGFKGKITLELTNHSPWIVELPAYSEVGQLYLFKCSSDAIEGYAGRYAEDALSGPTIPIWQRK